MPTLFPYTTLFRSPPGIQLGRLVDQRRLRLELSEQRDLVDARGFGDSPGRCAAKSRLREDAHRGFEEALSTYQYGC